jgi:hypothetical protein
VLDVDALLIVIVVLCVIPLVAAIKVKVITKLKEVLFASTILNSKRVISALEVNTKTYKYALDILLVKVSIIIEIELEPSILARRLS